MKKKLLLFLFETGDGFDAQIVRAIREDAERRRNRYCLQVIHIRKGEEYLSPSNAEEPVWVIPTNDEDEPVNTDLLTEDCESLSIMLNPGEMEFEAIALSEATSGTAVLAMTVGSLLIKALHKYGVGYMDAILLFDATERDNPHIYYALEAYEKAEEIENVIALPWQKNEQQPSRKTAAMLVSTLTLERSTLIAYTGRTASESFTSFALEHLDAPAEHVRAYVLRSTLETMLNDTIRPAAEGQQQGQTLDRSDIELIRASVLQVFHEVEDACTGGFPMLDELYAMMPIRMPELSNLKEEITIGRAWKLITDWYGPDRAAEIRHRFQPDTEQLRSAYLEAKTRLGDCLLRGTAEVALNKRRPITDLQGMLDNVCTQIEAQLEEKKPPHEEQQYKKIGFFTDRDKKTVMQSARAVHVVFDAVYNEATKQYSQNTTELRHFIWQQVCQTAQTFYRDCMSILADRLTGTYNQLDVGHADFQEGFDDAYGFWFKRNCNDFAADGDQLFLRHIGEETMASSPERSAESLHNKLYRELENYRDRKLEPIKLQIEKFFPELKLREELLRANGDSTLDLNESLLNSLLEEKVPAPFVAEVGSNFNPVKRVFVFGKGLASDGFSKRIKANQDGKADLWNDAFENSVEMLVRFEMRDKTKLGIYRLNRID